MTKLTSQTMTNNENLTSEDEKHIARIQELRDSGDYNMFTEFYPGLKDNFTLEEAEETYQWVKDNWEYYQSGDWTVADVEINELPDPSDREIVQMMAAQQVVMDNHEHLHDEYEEQIREFARKYDVDHQLLQE